MHLDRSRVAAGAISGAVAGAAFAAAMQVDMAVSRQRVDDFRLIGGIGPWSAHWQLKGALLHGMNSLAIGSLYSLVEPRLRGPGWCRGLSFALIENSVLWPLVIVLDRRHPDIRSGELPRFNRPWPFVAENLRHAVYGLVLGTIFERIQPSTAPTID